MSDAQRKSYRDVRQAMVGNHEPEGAFPCLFCTTPTNRDTLSTLGARCFPCYVAYCKEGFSDIGPLSIADKRDIMQSLRSFGRSANSPRNWARKLKERHEAGECLTPAQINAYRDCLRQRPDEDYA